MGGSVASSALGVPRATLDINTIAEDTLLHKLRWYELGGRGSERQWGNVLGILRVQTALDLEYLRRWAAELGLSGLLEEAFAQAAMD